MKSRRIWTKAASTALALTIGTFACAPCIGACMQPAWADAQGGTGTVTIEKAQANGTVSYDGYRIFKANVKAGSNAGGSSKPVASDIAWASDEMQAAVTGVLSAWGKANSAEYAGRNAQEAADYLKAHLNGPTATDESTRIAAGSLGQELAKALASGSSQVKATKTGIAPGEAVSLDSGYWLFVTGSGEEGGNANAGGPTDTAGTAPIYALVGGGELTIHEKTSIPTIKKLVKEDGTSDGYAAAADSCIGQKLCYQVTGTVADNIASYDAYQYEIEDSLDEDLQLDTSSVEVTATAPGEGGTRTTQKLDPSCYTLTPENHKLDIKFADLRKITASGTKDKLSVDKDTAITVTYKAQLTSTAKAGEGHANTAKLRYSNNPLGTGTGVSTASVAKAYTYALDLHKVDRITEQRLSGAKFTLKNNDTKKYIVANKDGNGKYTVTGTAATDPTELEGDSNGIISISGLDAGTYFVRETTAPDGYSKAENFTVTISPSYTKGGDISTLDCSLSDSGYVIAGTPNGVTTDNELTAKDDTDVSQDKGTVTVTVGDTKKLALPLTGMSGIALTWVAGGIVLLLTAAYAIRSRRRRDSAN